MRKFLAACIAAAVCVSPAFAADMTVKARSLAAPAPVYGWSGCYVGGNIGAGWQRTKTNDVEPSTVPPLETGSDTGAGLVGGGQLGCDSQFAPNWVVGIQGMFDGASIRGDHFAPFAYAADTTENFSARADWFGTLTARLGYVMMPQTLLYLKGGVAWVHEKYADQDTSAVPVVPYLGTASSTRTGWTLGVGGEYLLGQNWSLFAEYDYIGLASKTSALTYSCGAGCGFPDPYHYAEDQNLQTALVGLNYRFGGLFAAKH